MTKTCSMRPFRYAIAMLILGLPWIVSLLACSLAGLSTGANQSADATSTSLSQTRAALDVLLTGEAQNATSQAEQTRQAANQALPTSNPVVEQMQATLDAQATLIAQEAQPPSPTPPVEKPTPTSKSASDTVVLDKWKFQAFKLDPKCSESSANITCWSSPLTYESLLMETVERILIPSDWDRPYLLFEHRYKFDTQANVLIRADGPWNILWTFQVGGSAAWVPVEIDLSKYKGKEVLIRFVIDGSASNSWTVAPKNQWTIRDVQIVPERR